jgi:hypothetical protein
MIQRGRQASSVACLNKSKGLDTCTARTRIVKLALTLTVLVNGWISSTMSLVQRISAIKSALSLDVAKPTANVVSTTHSKMEKLVTAEKMRELLKAKRKNLGLTRHQMRNHWVHTNSMGHTFIFATYKRKNDRLNPHKIVATLAWYHPVLHVWIPQ